jgi:hypothetical protein
MESWRGDNAPQGTVMPGAYSLNVDGRINWHAGGGSGWGGTYGDSGGVARGELLPSRHTGRGIKGGGAVLGEEMPVSKLRM